MHTPGPPPPTAPHGKKRERVVFATFLAWHAPPRPRGGCNPRYIHRPWAVDRSRRCNQFHLFIISVFGYH